MGGGVEANVLTCAKNNVGEQVLLSSPILIASSSSCFNSAIAMQFETSNANKSTFF